MPHKDPEVRKKYKREWAEKNKDKLKAYKAQYYLTKPDKERRAKYAKTYRPLFREERRKWFKEVKKDLFCIRCGENRIICLDFHHRNPKEKEKGISFALYSYSKKRLLEEITKCDILCANCHRVEHEGETNG